MINRGNIPKIDLKEKLSVNLDKLPKVNLLKTNVAPIPKSVKKKLKGSKKAKTPEKEIQRAVENYLTVLGITPIRIPDSLYRSIYANRSISLHIKADIARSISGLPDLMIPKLTDKGLMILPLELKTSVGKLGPKQIKWQRHLGTVVARSFEDAKILIDNFLER